ncbi:anthranilate phosphoribosyltransferase [Radiobacillus kanasensis]|uniref:anthranilate phosphoribosyltransferase n=1 Tax=Radiobacillus kanasensis TaxID=2844358 RepID=UPI001E443007|nr:anthranilate phosphoribosyltransferase [Radiobacillus kanasensis]UFU00673.1 anthranilate phosphoribosyltransferase [Radiobacillus kanasensis]
MQKWLKEVARGKKGSKDLSYEETKKIAEHILSGSASDAQIAGYLIAQRMKTEAPEELLAFVHVLQEERERIDIPKSLVANLIDFAGPYNGRNYFAATIPCSILLADFGIPAYLHSSDTLPPKFGVSVKDILISLGIETEGTTDQVAHSLQQTNLAFVWTEKFSKGLTALRSIREEIGVRTLLNTAEKLLNIPNASSLMMGAFHRTAIQKIYPILSKLSYDRIFIVQGLEGSEDVPVHRNSFVYRINQDLMEHFLVKPEEYGLLNKEFDKTKKISVQEQKQIIESILSGEKRCEYTYYYNQVVLNTAIRYYLFGASRSIEEGIDIAKDQLQNKRGLDILNRWKNQNERKSVSISS